MAKGVFITFEGIDGSGKSTQARFLAAHLRESGRQPVLTREPGGSRGAEQIRSLVLEGEPDRWSAETEILLFAAARRDHLEKIIEPALAAEKIVISDRFADSTRVYQGIGRGIGGGDLRGVVDKLHSLMIGREPELTFILDMDPATGLARALSRKGAEERFEGFGEALQTRIRAAFLELAREFSGRCVVIDGNRDIGTVARDIARIADGRLT